MSERAQHERAYRAAHYCIVSGATRIDRRIGAVDPAADAALAAAGCRTHWAVLTPCNPGSRRLSAADNARRLARFRAEVAAHGWRTLEAVNHDSSGDWREPGLCLLDAPPAALRALAQRYGQRAFVEDRLGAAPQLRWTDDR